VVEVGEARAGGARVRVLEGFSLDVAPGSHVAIVGPSGSGKTTLLRVLAGDSTAQRGEVRIDGRVATIHQDFRLVGSSTAMANVLHGAAGRAGLWRSLFGYGAALRAEARSWLERLGLAARERVRVERLSGGEQQRVAIARALMSQPDILLADEPVASLDPASAHALLQLLDELRRRHGLTLVTVLHDRALAQQYADRIVSLTPVASSGATPANEGFARASVAAAPPTWKRWLGNGLATAAVALGCVMAVRLLELSWPDSGVFANIRRFTAALVPSATQWAALDFAVLGKALFDTLLMAWLGTIAAVFVSLPMAAGAAGNVAPSWLRVPLRALLNAIRAVPSLLWALLAVGAFGLGALPGVVALAAYSIGYLTKFYYEALESVDAKVPRALRSLGLSRTQQFFAGIAPASRLPLLSATVFMLEYNFRTATVLGIVGAGGIGYELKLAVDWGNWHVVGVILAILVIAVIVFDALAARLRARFS